jgi:hypothetical protein
MVESSNFDETAETVASIGDRNAWPTMLDVVLTPNASS